MINPTGRKCQLRMHYSKSDEDVVISYPKSEAGTDHALLLLALFDETTMKTLTDLGYDPKSIRFSIGIDWSNPVAKTTFAKLYKKIQESIPTDYNQLSLFDDLPVERTTMHRGKPNGA